MPLDNPSPLAPAGKPGIAAPLAAIAIGIAGIFAANGALLGRDGGERLDGLLAMPFGPEGVRHLRDLASLLFSFLACGGLAWLLRRRPPPAGTDEIRKVQLAWLELRVAVLLLVLPLAATVAAWQWMGLKARAAWPGEWWAADGFVRGAVAVCGGLTLLSALSLVARIRELRSPPADRGGTGVSRPR